MTPQEIYNEIENAWKDAAIHVMTLREICAGRQPNPDAFTFDEQLKGWDFQAAKLRSVLDGLSDLKKHITAADSGREGKEGAVPYPDPDWSEEKVDGWNAAWKVVAASGQIRETLRDLLRRYRCQYTKDESGDGLQLVDVLSPGETIQEGQNEIDHLADAVLDLLPEPPPKAEPIQPFGHIESILGQPTKETASLLDLIRATDVQMDFNRKLSAKAEQSPQGATGSPASEGDTK